MSAQRPHGRGGLTLACRLLPASVREDVFGLYAVFRTLDDLVDGGARDAEGRVEAVERWVAGTSPAPSPEVAALSSLASRHPLPPEALRDFCAGMRHDLAGDSIATEADLDRYCYRVAGTVGLMVTAMLGSRRDCEAEAAALGIAMQRTNILRDVEEDRAFGRRYLAGETLRAFGAPRLDRTGLVRDQVARAGARYEEGMAGLVHLRRGRAAVTAAAATYRELLRELERRPHEAGVVRAVVPTWRKLLVAGGAWGGMLLSTAHWRTGADRHRARSPLPRPGGLARPKRGPEDASRARAA